MSEQKQWRFYRSNLSSVVWDRKTDQPLADFSNGHFTTDNPKVAKYLKSLGYVEISLDATEPPPDIIIHQPSFVIDGDVPIMRPGISELDMQKRMESRTHKVGGPSPVTGIDEEAKKSNKVGKITKLPQRRKK